MDKKILIILVVLIGGFLAYQNGWLAGVITPLVDKVGAEGDAVAALTITVIEVPASNTPDAGPKVGEKCPDCNGTGKVGDGRVFAKCLACDGTGKVQPKTEVVGCKNPDCKCPDCKCPDCKCPECEDCDHCKPKLPAPKEEVKPAPVVAPVTPVPCPVQPRPTFGPVVRDPKGNFVRFNYAVGRWELVQPAAPPVTFRRGRASCPGCR